MPNVLSDHTVEALDDEDSDEVFLTLIKITHPNLPDALRFTCDNVATFHRGEVYQPAAFQAVLPDSQPETPPRATLRIDGVDNRVVEALRTIITPPKIDFVIVAASVIDAIEEEWRGLTIIGHTIDDYTIDLHIIMDKMDQEPFPVGTFDKRFSALFP